MIQRIETATTDDIDVAVQGAGMPDRALGATYTNTDYALVDDADTVFEDPRDVKVCP